MQQNRTLLISDICPGAELTAGIALEKFVRHFNQDSYSFTICDSKLQTMLLTGVISPINSYWGIKPNENWSSTNLIFSYFGEILASLETMLLHKRIERLILRERINHIVIVLQGQTMYRIFKLLEDKAFTVTTITWDPWDWWSSANKVPISTNRLVNRIQKSFRTKGFHLVSSKRMGENLRLQENMFKNFILPAYEIELQPKEDKALQNNVIKIVFSGQSYAIIEITKFIDILNRLNWCISTFRIELHVIGKNDVPNGANIYHHGWLDQERLIKTLNQMNVAFLPYPLEGLPESVARESYPSKLSDYSYVGLPVIFMGPKNCEARENMKDFSVLITEELTLKQIHNQFLSLFSNLSLYKLNSQAYYDAHCSKKVFDSNVSRMFIADNLQNANEGPCEEPKLKIPLNQTNDLSLKFYPSHGIRKLSRLIELSSNELFFRMCRNQFIKVVRLVFHHLARCRILLLTKIR